MQKTLTKADLYEQNILAVRILEQQKSGLSGIRTARKNEYLKLCWFCGKPYTAHKRNSYACSPHCSQNLARQQKAGVLPPAKMDMLTKERNIKGILERMGFGT